MRRYDGLCSCCRQPLAESYCDAPFCWTCGLYWRDPADQCDEPEHGQPGYKRVHCGVGWPG